MAQPPTAPQAGRGSLLARLRRFLAAQLAAPSDVRDAQDEDGVGVPDLAASISDEPALPSAAMAGPRTLIVGLGNPEPEYAATRHNVGVEVVRAIAARVRVRPERYHARSLGADARWKGRPFALAMPQTYMNLSGESVLGLVRQFGLTPRDVLVVVDDLALDPGVLRLRGSGSDGGHNGLADITERLKTDQFPRLRIGIGRDFARGRQADYVLERFTAAQRAAIDACLPVAAEAALTVVADGLQTAMNRFNGWAPPPPADASPVDVPPGV